jgi:hypothetical protein
MFCLWCDVTYIPVSPSPSNLERSPGGFLPSFTSHLSALSVASRNNVKRPSIVTSLSNGSTASLTAPQPLHRRNGGLDSRQLQLQWEREQAGQRRHGMSRRDSSRERTIAWREASTTAMTRSASDGADVFIPESGYEWKVINPHGTGKGRQSLGSSKQSSGASRPRRR